MGTPVNDKGEPISDPQFLVAGGIEAHHLTNVVYSSDVGGTPKTSTDSLSTGEGVLGSGLNSTDASNGSIKEIKLLSNNNGLRHFTVTDSAIAKQNEGVFQYSVEIEMLDPVEILASQALATISTAKLEMLTNI